MIESPFRFIHNFSRYLSAIKQNSVIKPIASRTFFNDIFSTSYAIGNNPCAYVKVDISDKFEALDESDSSFKESYSNTLESVFNESLGAIQQNSFSQDIISYMAIPTFVGGLHLVYEDTMDDGSIVPITLSFMFTTKANGSISSVYVFLGGK
jgi:hypothetical protein